MLTLTDQGIAACEKLLGIESLYDDIQGEWVHHINQALRAHNLYRRDVDYVIKDGEIIIVDEFTGRLMPGRRWSEGLHQAVEAKENIRIQEENRATLATIAFAKFFPALRKAGGHDRNGHDRSPRVLGNLQVGCDGNSNQPSECTPGWR